jgi:hypothetical protein
MGTVATAVALYYVDRRTDLQTIQFDEIDLSALYDRYWPQLTGLLRGELPSPGAPSEDLPTEIAIIPADEPDSSAVPPADAPPEPAEPVTIIEAAPEIAPGPAGDAATSESAIIPLEDAGSETVLADPPAPDDALPIEPAPAVEAPPLEPAGPAPAWALNPIPVDQGVLYNNTGRDALAPLNIVTNPDRDYFVKLVDVTTGENAFGIYVRGGSVAEFEVPLGSYEVRYASGSTWYGTGDLFGPETAYAKAADTFDFTEDADGYVGYTLTLIMQEGGNLDTQAIAPESF